MVFDTTEGPVLTNDVAIAKLLRRNEVSQNRLLYSPTRERRGFLVQKSGLSESRTKLWKAKI